MRILVLGGYGGFGARIAATLAGAGHDVVAAGRSLAASQAFCAGRPGLSPLALDASQADAVATALRRLAPFAVVDAAGPFQGPFYQGETYALPRACIAAGCHYVDIADGRAFVERIGRLDDLAKAAGVSVIAGASTVPALSGAVVRALADGMDRVAAVDIAISGSNRATAGPSVTRAILSYVGKPIRLWSRSQWTTGHGWQDLRFETLALAGIAPIRPRLVGLADVPDLGLLPGRLPGRPGVRFHAGTELAVQNLGLWLLSWPVRWGWCTGLAPLIRLLLALQRLMKGLGSDRSGMVVRVSGSASGARLARRWTLVADQGDGPSVPTLAVPLVVDRLIGKTLPPGAYDAGPLFDLAAFEPAFGTLHLRHERTESPLPPPLYRRVMGDRFATLPASLRAMHDVFGTARATGHAVVTRGHGFIARTVAAVIGFPATGSHDVEVAFTEWGQGETWTRSFSKLPFASRLSQRGPLLVEAFGPLRFGFDLPSRPDGLAMVLRRWWLGPLPLPLALAPRSSAREWDDAGTFAFDVAIHLPVVGLLVRYTGRLDPPKLG